MKLLKLFNLKILAGALIFSFAVPAFSQNTCEQLFKTSLLNKVTNLVVKNAEANPPATKYFGFATQIPNGPRGKYAITKALYFVYDLVPNGLGRLITLNKSYRFTPFKAIDDLIFDKPAHIVSERLSGKKKELRLWLKLPLMVMLSISSWNAFDTHIYWPHVEYKAKVAVIEHITKNASHYDHLIESDYRYREINDTIPEQARQKDHSISSYNRENIDSYIEKNADVKARYSAFGIEQSYKVYFDQYLKYYQENKKVPDSLEENLRLFGASPLFTHLNFFFENGVTQVEGAYVAPQHRGPLNEVQMQRLFDLTHLMYAKYLTIDVMFRNEAQIQNLIAKNKLAEDIYNDPYTQKLISLRKEGKLSKEEMIFAIQEDARHMYYMQLFNYLHIVNFKAVGNNQYSTETLTLNDLRAARLAEIN